MLRPSNKGPVLFVVISCAMGIHTCCSYLKPPDPTLEKFTWGLRVEPGVTLAQTIKINILEEDRRKKIIFYC